MAPKSPFVPAPARLRKLGKKIGAGTFGTVHQGLNEDTGMAIAVKVLGRSGRHITEGEALEVRELENEISVMRELDHPNIVRYLGCEADSGALYIFQEWVPCGSVADVITAYGPLKEPVARKYLRDMLRGLEYLHSKRVAHRDIKVNPA